LNRCHICGKPATKSCDVEGREGTTFHETVHFCDRHTLQECSTALADLVREFMEDADAIVVALHTARAGRVEAVTVNA